MRYAITVRTAACDSLCGVDKSRSRRYGGAGLGLALVREIALLHDAEIRVEESSDEGTTMAIHFPKMRNASLKNGSETS